MISNKKEKILILSGNYGEGHQQAAHALRKAIKARMPQAEPIVLDFMAWAHPYLNPIGRYLFMQGIKKFPQVYGYLYNKTRGNNSSSMLLKACLNMGLGKMLKLLQEIQPTVVVSTFPIAAGVMSRLKSYGVTNIPTVTIITDHTDHSSWVHPYTDHYIVGSTPVRQALQQMGVKDTRISDIGIPVRLEFLQSYDRQALMDKHGLDPDIPTILIMGGGCGMIGDGLTMFRSLETISHPVQLIIVCGHNEQLREQLKEGLKDSKHRIVVTGYIHFVHELMAISDLMITKPGGITTSEAVVMKLPMLLYKPLPGQEQDNTHFLRQEGLAIEAENITDLTVKLSHVIQEPKVLLVMKENAKRFYTKSSAFDALDIILQTKKQGAIPVSSLSSGITWSAMALIKKRFLLKSS